MLDVIIEIDHAQKTRQVSEITETEYCAGRMQLIATIEDPAVIQRILGHLGLSGTREGPPPCSMTEVGGEQPALPGVTV